MEELGEPLETGCGRGDSGWSLTDLIVATEFVCATGKWIPQSRCMEKDPSSSAIRGLLIDKYRGIDNKVMDTFRAFLSGLDISHGCDIVKILEEKYVTPTDDFGWNIYNNLYVEDIEDGKTTRRLRSYIPSKAAGLICFAIFQAIHGDFRKKENQEKQKTNKSVHVGTKGERTIFKVKVVTVKNIIKMMTLGTMPRVFYGKC